MTDKIYLNLKKYYKDVYSIPPNTLGNPILTKLYKICTYQLKNFPFKLVVPISVLITILSFGLFGILIIRVVTILQFGF